jgi:hypothetical protein
MTAKYCWAVRFCHACYKYFIKNHKWHNEKREEICRNMRIGILKDLILYSEIIEINPKAFEYMKDVEIEI